MNVCWSNGVTVNIYNLFCQTKNYPTRNFLHLQERSTIKLSISIKKNLIIESVWGDDINETLPVCMESRILKMNGVWEEFYVPHAAKEVCQ